MNTPHTLDRAGIAARIPHAGRMCLLHELQAWSAQHVVCRTSSHLDADNPLRDTDGALPAAAAIEYASQAMALHGSLAAAPGRAPQAGFLAAVRGVRLLVPRLDRVDGPLTVTAQSLAGDARQALYRFSVSAADGRLLVDGRATVILDALP